MCHQISGKWAVTFEQHLEEVYGGGKQVFHYGIPKPVASGLIKQAACFRAELLNSRRTPEETDAGDVYYAFRREYLEE